MSTSTASTAAQRPVTAYLPQGRFGHAVVEHLAEPQDVVLSVDHGLVYASVPYADRLVMISDADRTPVRGNKTVPVNFLGHTAHLPQGPWLLAGLLRAPTNTVFVLKEQGRYHLCLKRFQTAPSWTAATRKQVIENMAQQYADVLAAHAARAPLQWFNFYDFWSNTPHG